MRLLAAALVLSTGLGTACEGDSMPAMAPCADETRADVLQEGERFEGERFAAVVQELQPAPPTVGRNDWDLIVQGLGAECSVSVETLMPDHGHGSDAGTLTTDGSLVQIRELEISMGGYWQVLLDVQCPSDAADTDAEPVQDTVMLELCVDA